MKTNRHEFSCFVLAFIRVHLRTKGVLMMDKSTGCHCFQISPIRIPQLKCRALVPVRVDGTVVSAWLYVVRDRWTGGFKELTGGIWR
jgi:hypothetical protein